MKDLFIRHANVPDQMKSACKNMAIHPDAINTPKVYYSDKSEKEIIKFLQGMRLRIGAEILRQNPTYTTMEIYRLSNQLCEDVVPYETFRTQLRAYDYKTNRYTVAYHIVLGELKMKPKPEFFSIPRINSAIDENARDLRHSVRIAHYILTGRWLDMRTIKKHLK